MKKEKLISIIIPVYKVEQYLNECIESVLNQSYKNLEIILIDDGSPDNCGKICDEYAKIDKRIKVVHKENGGLSSARNTGLDIANGEYISFIDSDDYVSKKFIKVLYDLCERNNADIAMCDYIRFTDKVEDIKTNIEIKRFTSLEMQENIYSREGVKNVVVWNKLYKKYIYDELRFPAGKINEDEFTTYKAFNIATNDIVVTNEPLYYYRYNENGIMGRTFNEKRLDALEAYREKKYFYKKSSSINLYEKTVVRYQELLIEDYILTKQYIKKPDKYLDKILKEAHENFNEYKSIKKTNYKIKLKSLFFMICPDLYYWIIILKRKIRKN